MGLQLCCGWIDSQADSFDDEYWLVRFTPRRPKSKWSQVNRGKVSKLIEEGRMKTAGRGACQSRWPLGGVI